MAQIARITGLVTHTEFKSGDFEGKPWSFWEAIILVAGRQTVTVRLDRDVPTPSNGEEADYLIELQAGRGDNVKLRAVAPYPVSVTH